MAMTVECLRSWVQQASHTNPHLTSRLEKAAFIVLLRPVMQVGDDRYRVMSEDGLRWYEVKDGQCDCYDYVRHGPGHPCKHRIAVSLVQQFKNGPLNNPAASSEYRKESDCVDLLYG